MTTLDLSRPADLALAVLPEMVLMGGAMLLLIWAALRNESDGHQRRVGVAAIGLCVLTLGIVAAFVGRYESVASGPVALDDFRWLMDVVILIGTALTIALSLDDNRREGIAAAESHVLVLLASSGMMLLAGARDLIVVFLGVELMSIAVYALAAINRRSVRGAEGALKYFLLGAFSTAFFLYGIALLYGATGSTNLTVIGNTIPDFSLALTPLVLAGSALLLIGFGFKIAAVPFHMWAPDVYDGAPSPITAYMAATVKGAAFAAFFRVWSEGLGTQFLIWYPAVHGLAVATMIAGNLIGLAQRNLKRLLAYSSIGHAGYLLVAIAARNSTGGFALLFYLFVYTLATFSAFAVLVTVQRPGSGTVMIDELAGLWKVRPWLALAMGTSMLALLGFPLFGGAGFFAKWYILQAAMRAPVPLIVLSVVLVLTTVISAGYYLHVVMVMFMRPRPEGAADIPAIRGVPRAVLVASVALLLGLGLYPDPAVRLASRARIEMQLTPPPSLFQGDDPRRPRPRAGQQPTSLPVPGTVGR